MKSHIDWIDIKNYEIIIDKQAPPGTTFTYPVPCGPRTSGIVLRALTLICQTQFKEQILRVVDDSKVSGPDAQHLASKVDEYFENFVNAINLPGVKAADISQSFTRGDYNDDPRACFIIFLKEQGIDLNAMNTAIEAEINECQSREFLWAVLQAGFGIYNTEIKDSELHDIYVAVYRRLIEIAKKRGITDFMSYYFGAVGYKLEEAMAVHDLIISINKHNAQFFKVFFNIKGSTLYPILSQALGNIYPKK